MKRLLAIVIILGIIAYVTVQVIKDRRFNPSGDYDYKTEEVIDTDFYDPGVLSEYYATVLEVGTFGRSIWRTHMYDVRQPEEGNSEEQLKADYYNSLIAKARMLESKLVKSKNYRDQGYSTKEIKMLMEKGWTPQDLTLYEKSYMIGLSRGSNGSAVWELQKMLNTLGDSIPEDGLFNLITTNRLKEFQSNNDLYPSGEVDKNTLRALLK